MLREGTMSCEGYVRRMLCEGMKSAPGDDVNRGDDGTKLCERMVRARRMLHVTRGDEAVREDDTHEEDAT